MVRSRRIGAKEKLANAQAEIAALKAALSDPSRVADAISADCPGIVEIGPDTQVKVTGGMTRKQTEEKVFGKSWWCKVTELQLPFAKDVHQVATWCRGGQRVQTFRANTEVLLPESEINKLENDCVVTDQRIVQVGEGGMELAAAKALNTGMEISTDKFGQTWLVRRQPRFHVQRLRPEQESIHIR